MDEAGIERPTGPTRRRRSWLALLLLAGLAFALGVAATVFGVYRSERAREALVGPVAAPAAMPAGRSLPEPQPVVPMPAPAPAFDSATEDRIAALESEVAALRASSSTAIGNAGRAEGLLLAIAARRALDRGAGLGYLEGMLRDRFGGTEPGAVAAILAAARAPVTTDSLRAGLESLDPVQLTATPERGWWEAVRSEIGSLVSIRRNGADDGGPEAGLRRARALVNEEQVDKALAEVARLPGRNAAAAWMAAARRYIAARTALDRIETAAILQPPAPVVLMPVPEGAAEPTDPMGLDPAPTAATGDQPTL